MRTALPLLLALSLSVSTAISGEKPENNHEWPQFKGGPGLLLHGGKALPAQRSWQ